MQMQLSERLENHPELKKHVEEMLDIAEDITDTLKKADDAEIKVVDNMRKMSATLLYEWACHQENKVKNKWKKENPNAIGHGKKKSTGKQLLED